MPKCQTLQSTVWPTVGAEFGSVAVDGSVTMLPIDRASLGRGRIPLAER